MMQAAVEGGTGTAAKIPGVTVGGKTGTAETGIAGPEHDLVHQLRGQTTAGGRNRGRRRAAELDRRRNGSPGRPRRLAGAFGGARELLTCTAHMASGDHLIDTLFDGRYLIIRKLGSGGMANVYLAVDQELGRRVAIKILDDRHARDEQFVERFRREAQNAAGLSHPSIVSIYDRGDSEGTYYIAMEYVEGRTLKELLVARGPSPLGIAIDYTRQILSALRFAHRNGIVHRDIKPHNVIVDGEGRVKVMDFGIARAGAASQMTEAGSIIGTAQYLSPEQARGAPVDQTSDLYSTGIVLYELLTGSVPFTGETPVEIAMKHLSQAPVPPSAHRPEVPRDLDYVVLRALAKDPADRYHSAEEMDSDLERIARGIGVSAETAEAATIGARADGGRRGGDDDRARGGRRARPTRPAVTTSTTNRRAGGRSGRGCSQSLLVAGALVGGWFAYQALQDQLSSRQAGRRARRQGRRRAARRHEDPRRGPQGARPARAERGRQGRHRLRAGPAAGRPDRERATSSRSSSRPGQPKTQRPERRRPEPGPGRLGSRQRRAEGERRFQSTRSSPSTRCSRRRRRPGTELVEGSTVRVNVSKGPKPITVPNVIGQRVRDARSPRSRASASRSPARTSRILRPPERWSARTRPPARSRARDP